jgi:peptide/nickel transport system permease protein
MVQYIVRRFLNLIPVWVGVLVITFLIMHLTPGDPARMVAGAGAAPETVLEIRAQLGLDQPLLVQFTRYVGNVLRGDFGRSYHTGEPVLSEISWRYRNTGLLSVVSLCVATLIGVTAGGLAARYPYSLLDNVSMVIALIGISTPVFWLGLILMYVFGVQLGWLPTGGSGTWLHLILPSVTLGLAMAGIIARMTRSSLLEVIYLDYIRTARAYGFADNVVVYKYALRNAILPVLTIVGLQLGYSLAGAVLTETVFAWPGLGRLIVNSIFNRDYPMIQAGLLWVSVTFTLVNFAVDILYSLADPRIRYD